MKAATLRRLLAELQTGELRRDAAARQIGTSYSCICQCFAALAQSGLVQVVRREFTAHNHPTKPVYRLTADAGEVAQFLAALEPRKAVKVAPVLQVVRPDPFALPMGFFGRERAA